MKIRTFTAPNMQVAMQLAREELGEDAVLLTSEKDAGGLGINATFALDEEELDIGAVEEYLPMPVATTKPAAPAPKPQARSVITPAPKSSPHSAPPVSALHILRDVLTFHRLPEALQSKCAELAGNYKAKPAENPIIHAQAMLAHTLKQLFQFKPIPFHQEGLRLMLVGPAGYGKTLTVAKIATQMASNKHNVKIISTDTKRAGGIEQLSRFMEILGIEMEVAATRTELRNLLKQYPVNTRVIVDSPGCNPYDFQDLKELGELANLADLEPVLLCAAGIDTGEAEEIAGVFSFLEITRMIVSKADCARRFGSLFAAAHTGGYAFCNLTSSPLATGELKPLDSLGLAHLLMQYQHERTTL